MTEVELMKVHTNDLNLLSPRDPSHHPMVVCFKTQICLVVYHHCELILIHISMLTTTITLSLLASSPMPCKGPIVLVFMIGGPVVEIAMKDIVHRPVGFEVIQPWVLLENLV